MVDRLGEDANSGSWRSVRWSSRTQSLELVPLTEQVSTPEWLAAATLEASSRREAFR